MIKEVLIAAWEVVAILSACKLINWAYLSIRRNKAMKDLRAKKQMLRTKTLRRYNGVTQIGNINFCDAIKQISDENDKELDQINKQFSKKQSIFVEKKH